MRLTNAHKAAGIVKISNLRNRNGSYQVTVELDKIDTEENGTNFRKFSGHHQNEIQVKFNHNAVRNPILLWNKKTRRLQTIDGRHTVAILKALKETKWTADVYFDLTEQEAGAVFYELTQNSKRMAPWDAFAAALQSEYPFALDIDAALIRHGFTTPNDDGFNSNTADLNGFTPLFDSWEKGNNFLHLFLTVLSVWKYNGNRLHKDARKSPFQRGLIDFLTEYSKDFSARDLAAILGKRNPAEIVERATDLGGGGDRIERGHYKLAFVSILEIGQQRRAA